MTKIIIVQIIILLNALHKPKIVSIFKVFIKRCYIYIYIYIYVTNVRHSYAFSYRKTKLSYKKITEIQKLQKSNNWLPHCLKPELLSHRFVYHKYRIVEYCMEFWFSLNHNIEKAGKYKYYLLIENKIILQTFMGYNRYAS